MEEKQSYISKALAWAKSNGFKELRTGMVNNSSYQSPISYERRQDEEQFIPDLTGKKIDSKSYFEIILKTDKVQRLISKLKLMGVLAARREGKLYVMVPKGHYQFAKNIVEENQIMARIVRL